MAGGIFAKKGQVPTARPNDDWEEATAERERKSGEKEKERERE